MQENTTFADRMRMINEKKAMDPNNSPNPQMQQPNPQMQQQIYQQRMQQQRMQQQGMQQPGMQQQAMQQQRLNMNSLPSQQPNNVVMNMDQGNEEMPEPEFMKDIKYEPASGYRWKYAMEADSDNLINGAVLTQEQKDFIQKDPKTQSEGYLGCLTCYGCIPKVEVVNEGFNGLIMKMGKFDRKVDPGLRNLNPCTESIIRVDMKAQTLTLSQQQLLTADTVSIKISSFCIYKVTDPVKTTFKISGVAP